MGNFLGWIDEGFFAGRQFATGHDSSVRKMNKRYILTLYAIKNNRTPEKNDATRRVRLERAVNYATLFFRRALLIVFCCP